jgi:hypothetical protein
MPPATVVDRDASQQMRAAGVGRAHRAAGAAIEA